MKLKSIKIVAAAFGSLIVAQVLRLSFASAAAIIAILSVLDTRKSSLQIAWQRLIASVLALTVAVIIFTIFGYTTISFGLYLAMYIPLAFKLHVEVGIAPSSVLAGHLWSSQQMDVPLLMNELALMGIGAGIAILLNWYMPSYQTTIAQLRSDVEELLRQILWKMASFLREGNGQNDALLIQQLQEVLEKAHYTVYMESENQVFNQVNHDLHYFEMRTEQTRLLEVMAKNLNDFRCSAQEADILADMFHSTAQQLHQMNSAEQLKIEIETYVTAFRQRPLPKTRSEFEYRATLFQLLRDLERFIDLKVDFYQKNVHL